MKDYKCEKRDFEKPCYKKRTKKTPMLASGSVTNEVFKVGKRWYPKRMVFKDVLKKGGGTEFIIDSIEFDVKIPEYIFSKASLRR